MVDLEKIQKLVRMMAEHDLSEISLRDGGEEINLKRCSTNASPIAAVPLAVPAAQPALAPLPYPAPTPSEPASPQEGAGATDDEELAAIVSPMVGTFYTSPNPDSPPFVQLGSTVGPDTVVCIVEAMKVFNEIKADVAGTIEKVLIADLEPVEYGQDLFLVRPPS